MSKSKFTIKYKQQTSLQVEYKKPIQMFLLKVKDPIRNKNFSVMN